jgi:hypothetical protein
MAYDPRQNLIESGIDPGDIQAIAQQGLVQAAQAAQAIENMRARYGADFDQRAGAISQTLMGTPGLAELSGVRPDLALENAYRLSGGGSPSPSNNNAGGSPWQFGSSQILDPRQQYQAQTEQRARAILRSRISHPGIDELERSGG